MNNKIMFLKENGVDFDTALNYMGDYETFNEILIDFYNGIDAQLKELEDCKNSNDITNYAILVHALKSNYRSLGISKYAEVAYNHELESKAGNFNFVNEHFSELLDNKDEFKTIVNKYLNM